jgi:hypothetical protein
MTKAKVKERQQKYGGKIPPDYLPAHNHVAHTPDFCSGRNGFRRFWIPPEWVEEGRWKECPCGWGTQPSTKGIFGVRNWGLKYKGHKHYAVADHVKGTEDAIKEHGSIEAAYRHWKSEWERQDAEFRKRKETEVFDPEVRQ